MRSDDATFPSSWVANDSGEAPLKLANTAARCPDASADNKNLSKGERISLRFLLLLKTGEIATDCESDFP